MTRETQNLPAYRTLAEQLFGAAVKGKGNPYTAMNGNMYSFLSKSGHVCLRMAEPDRARFAEIFGTEPVEQYGSVMKGYVEVPDALLANPDKLQEAFTVCLKYAKSLKPK